MISGIREGYIEDDFSIEQRTIETGENTWNKLEIEVFRNSKLVGSYGRNYSSFYNTFFPFTHNGKPLALYSPEYMYTRILDLETGKDLGGEDSKSVEYRDHFCPVDYFVPFYRKVGFKGRDGDMFYHYLSGEDCFDEEYGEETEEFYRGPIQYCDFGFVAGCAWGDDSSWKIQYLDLSRANEGILERENKLGYIELPDKMELKNSINLGIGFEPGEKSFYVTHAQRFDFDEDDEED